jgi:hypothetical protein
MMIARTLMSMGLVAGLFTLAQADKAAPASAAAADKVAPAAAAKAPAAPAPMAPKAEPVPPWVPRPR